MFGRYVVAGIVLAAAACGDGAAARPTGPQGRAVRSLDGIWELAEGALEDAPPSDSAYDRTVPVPGLVSLADPPLPGVGVPSAARDAFWYRTTFDGPSAAEARTTARLVVHKARYGLKAWLNGQALGEHPGCFTAAAFDAGAALRIDGPNTVVLRVGATREALPPTAPSGNDSEQVRFIPGIWDDVELVASGTPRILRAKVEPDLDGDLARVRTWLVHDGDGPVQVELVSAVDGFGRASDAVRVPPDGEPVEVVQALDMAGSRRWSPDSPTLYALVQEVREGPDVRDDLTTRFGMRTVRWESGPGFGGRFLLNGERTWLRGSNLTVHRFFEDPAMAGLPWDPGWVRRLLADNPKRLGWNAFRISLGRAPRLWYAIADEVGLLLADEFQMWNLIDRSPDAWSVDAMAAEYTRWVQEAWNHPSIAWWDASNETLDPKSGETVARVRGLDPTRQWENGGYNEPVGPDDPVEDHPYLFGLPLLFDNDIGRLERWDGMPGRGMNTWQDPDRRHPYINNEYGWLWIDRQGRPTSLTEDVWADLIGRDATADELREGYAYLTAEKTAFWRAHRGYAAVLHFAYLGYSREGGQTSDNFVDLEALALEPRWAAYAPGAFGPLGVYIDAWPDAAAWPGGVPTTVPILAISDLPSATGATLSLTAVAAADGAVAATADPIDVPLPAHGRASLDVPFTPPDLGDGPGAAWVLLARLSSSDPAVPDAWSRRKVAAAHPGAPMPGPHGD